MSISVEEHDRRWKAYFNEDGKTLRNHVNATTPGELRRAEYVYSDLRNAEMHLNPIPGKHDLEHLQKIHKQLFQDVYPWAGELRNVDIVKGGTVFALHDQIEQQAKHIHSELEARNYFKGMDKASFVEAMTQHMNEVNKLHPFREGNGRAARVHIDSIAREAGYQLDNQKINNDKGAWNEACKDAANGDTRALKEVFSEALRPMRAVAFEKLPEPEAKAAYPELAPAFGALKSLRTAMEKQIQDPNTREQMYEQARSTIVKNLEAGLVPTVQRQRTSPAIERNR